MTINSVNLNAWYLKSIDRILKDGTVRDDKVSITNQTISFCMGGKGLPLLTIKPTPWKLAIKELYWFISDSFDIADLEELGVIWWRPWTIGKSPYYTVDTFPYKKHHLATRRIISELQSDNPNPTRLVCSLWPDEDKLEQAILPPCACFYQVTLDSFVHLTVHQRSADLICGVPSNIIQYAFLLKYYSYISGRPAGKLAFHFGDLHIYRQHIESPNFIELTSDRRRAAAVALAEATDVETFTGHEVSLLTFKTDKLDRLELLGGYYHLPPLNFPVVPVHTK